MNNETLKNLEFIQITGSWSLPSMLAHLLFCRERIKAHSTRVENVRQIRLFLQNKPNFPHFYPKNEDYAKKQTQFKANSNPIKANFSLKIRGAKPNKANLTVRELHRWDRIRYMIVMLIGGKLLD